MKGTRSSWCISWEADDHCSRDDSRRAAHNRRAHVPVAPHGRDGEVSRYGHDGPRDRGVGRRGRDGRGAAGGTPPPPREQRPAPSPPPKKNSPPPNPPPLHHPPPALPSPAP